MTMNTYRCTGICSKCGRCRNESSLTTANAAKTKMMYFPRDFVPDTGEKGYGVAFDIGTTTVVGVLWDLCQARQIATLAGTNPQNAYGSDVISRIAFAKAAVGNLRLLRDEIVKTLNGMIKRLCAGCGLPVNQVMRVVMCGNTTMSHIVSGHNPETLARAPYLPEYEGILNFTPKQMELDINEQAKITVIPNIAGHVGGDITAGILAVRLYDADESTIFIDIGTNGEIACSNGKKMFACSTAAGPAFEGASIEQGMRAAVGAIEKVTLEDGDIQCQVVGNTDAVGICGSGLIDAVAQMVRLGIVNRSGRICKAEDYQTRTGRTKIAARIREGKDGRYFVLSEVPDGCVRVTQKDLREVQLAKGAISAGIKIMAEKMGTKIEKIMIAGAFGNHINVRSAITIGLLPELEEGRIISVGNTAGAGAVMAMASKNEMERLCAVPDFFEHVELAAREDFQKIYMREMAFRLES